MIDKKKDIGFNRKVRADWLKEALQLTASEIPRDEIESILKNKIVAEGIAKAHPLKRILLC